MKLIKFLFLQKILLLLSLWSFVFVLLLQFMIDRCKLLDRVLNFHSICQISKHEVFISINIFLGFWSSMLFCIQIQLLNPLWRSSVFWIPLSLLYWMSLLGHYSGIFNSPLALINSHLIFFDIGFTNLKFFPLNPRSSRSENFLNNNWLHNCFNFSMMCQQGSVCPNLKELVPSFPDHLNLFTSPCLKESKSKHCLLSVLALF